MDVSIEQGVEEGWITAGQVHDPIDVTPQVSADSIAEVLAEDRGRGAATDETRA
jgi:hypothetical protein